MALNLGEQLQRFIQPLVNRIGSMICCAMVKSVDDSGKLQLLKIVMYQDETKDKVERIQEFGFTSNPPADCEAVVLFVGGNRAHGIVVATDGSKYRPTDLPSGAVAVYNKNGAKIVLDGDDITVTNKGKVSVTCDGNVELTTKGDVTVACDGTFSVNGSKFEVVP